MDDYLQVIELSFGAVGVYAIVLIIKTINALREKRSQAPKPNRRREEIVSEKRVGVWTVRSAEEVRRGRLSRLGF